MSDRGFQIRDQYAVHFITCSVVEWVDVFTRKIYADILIDSLKFCQENKGLNIHSWCIMSNHIHLIISTNGITRLSDVIRDFKKFSSVAIIDAIRNNPHESRKNWMLWIFKSLLRRRLYSSDDYHSHPMSMMIWKRKRPD